MASRSLIVQPDDGVAPILDAITSARTSLRIKMFAFSDPALVGAVTAARRRGVLVRVMLNRARRSGQEDNEETHARLAAAGVDVLESNPAFALTHEKSMVVDDSTAFVTSFNWTTKNLTRTRDYGIVTDHRREVAEIVECFEADWDRRPFNPGAHVHLVWCPINGRDRIARMIDEAKHSLVVQNERYQDAVILERLVRAAQRGVKLHVMARSPHALKQDQLVEGVVGLRLLDDVGVKIRKLNGLRLHGKMLLADGVAAMVGSINLAPGSFDSRRELAIEVRDAAAVDRLHTIVRLDKADSHPLDLSDDGLTTELEDREEDAGAPASGE
ncbi:MAG TPA: phospholipase D-like domain-containing protein [Candidatus Dormibacteraeota bacterium]|jgi:phosphatidylserine/phosphatidylglycerophosphate/cardiolipin synthase-like enzyme